MSRSGPIFSLVQAFEAPFALDPGYVISATRSRDQHVNVIVLTRPAPTDSRLVRKLVLQLQLCTARPRTRGLLLGKSVQEVWEKKRKKGKIIIINKKLTGKFNMKKREENKHNIKKHIIMWGLVMLVSVLAWGSS